MELETFGWLLTDDGQALLDSAAAMLADGTPSLRVGERLRTSYAADRVATALGQLSLRVHAVAKFGPDAARMFFTREGLEQATRAPVAQHRAGRLRAFDATSVVDLGCGIGGDLVAFARSGLIAAGVDLDPVRVAIARANLAALGLPGAVSLTDASTVDHTGFDVAFVDPSRRTARGRVFDVADWTPSWSFVETLLGRDAVVKVAPGIPHDLVPAGVEAEWVSDRGEVKEAALWAGRLATCARRATVIGEGGLATLTEDDDPGGEEVALGRFLYEPDGAVIRAGLVTAVAAGVSGGLLDSHLAYVTAESSYRTPFARSYEVLEVLPHREKQLRSALRERGVGRLTIKKRGMDVVPEALRRRLQLCGDNEATIVLTRISGQGTCLLVRPF